MDVSLDFKFPTTIAAGSVYDQLAERIAAWAEAALGKTDPADLTDEEVTALAVVAGCEVEVSVGRGDQYSLRLKHRVAVTVVDGRFHVAEDRDAETEA